MGGSRRLCLWDTGLRRAGEGGQVSREGLTIFGREGGGLLAQVGGGACRSREVTFAQGLGQLACRTFSLRVGGDGGAGEILPSCVERGFGSSGTRLQRLGDFVEALRDACGRLGRGDGVARKLTFEGFELGLSGGC